MAPHPAADLGLGIGAFASAAGSPPEDGYGYGGSVPTDTSPHPQACTLSNCCPHYPLKYCRECQRDRNCTASPSHSAMHSLYGKQQHMGEGERSEAATSAGVRAVQVWVHHLPLTSKQVGAAATGQCGARAQDGSAGSLVPPHRAADSCGRRGHWWQCYPRPHTHCTPSGCRCFAPALD